MNNKSFFYLTIYFIYLLSLNQKKKKKKKKKKKGLKFNILLYTLNDKRDNIF